MKSDLLECVLGLGAGLFYNSPMEAVVVTLRSKKPPEHRGKVLFINAVNEVAREQAQSFLRESHQKRILTAYQAFADELGFSTVATLDQVADKGYSLAIPIYVAADNATGPDDEISVEDAVSQWRSAAADADDAVAQVISILSQEASR